jgi:hypothetical protein
MPEQAGIVTVGEKDGYVVTAFIPPLPEDMLFEATSSALRICNILHAKKDNTISGVVYEAGKLDLRESNLAKLKEEVTVATGYNLEKGITQLGARAIEAAGIIK